MTIKEISLITNDINGTITFYTTTFNYLYSIKVLTILVFRLVHLYSPLNNRLPRHSRCITLPSIFRIIDPYSSVVLSTPLV